MTKNEAASILKDAMKTIYRNLEVETMFESAELSMKIANSSSADEIEDLVLKRKAIREHIEKMRNSYKRTCTAIDQELGYWYNMSLLSDLARFMTEESTEDPYI